MPAGRNAVNASIAPSTTSRPPPKPTAAPSSRSIQPIPAARISFPAIQITSAVTSSDATKTSRKASSRAVDGLEIRPPNQAGPFSARRSAAARPSPNPAIPSAMCAKPRTSP